MAVPLIEPAFPEIVIDPRPPIEAPLPKSLASYFAPGSWQLDNPLMVESDRFKITLQGVSQYR